LPAPHHHRPPLSFPTRRSSDLDEATVEKALASISRPDACVFLASDTAVRALVSDPPLDVTNNILTVANFLKSYRGGKILFMSSGDRKSTRLNSSHVAISYAVFC